MKLSIRLFAVAVMIMLVACNSDEKPPKIEDLPEAESAYKAVNDSTVYGLACEGCTDSVLVLLPENCSDPVSYDIVMARRMNRVHGMPEIGDKVAILINPKNKREALAVVDLDNLKGAWVYDAMPTLRQSVLQAQEEASITREEKAEIDSAVRAQMKPHECGFNLKKDFAAMPIGRYWQRSSLEKEAPVEQPQVKRYTEWHIYNGKLILTETSSIFTKEGELKGDKAKNDTADILMLSRDTLVLKFKDNIQGYHRQKETGKK